VAADGAVGRAQVAWFPGLVQGAESVGNVLRELRAGGGVEVVLTASGEVKVLRARSCSRAWMISFGSARTGIG